jgi:hypothetical protein
MSYFASHGLSYRHPWMRIDLSNLPIYNKHIKQPNERSNDMPEQINLVKIFAKLMNKNEELLVDFIREYIKETEKEGNEDGLHNKNR